VTVFPEPAPGVGEGFRPGDRGLLVPGASVSLTAVQVDGQPTAVRINAGRGGSGFLTETSRAGATDTMGR